MNSFIKYIPKSLNDHKAFIEHLLSIIDTKLQFVNHRTNALISSLSSTSVLNHDKESNIDAFLAIDIGPVLSDQEAVFSLIEKYSKTTKLLLILRTKLNPKNVSQVYDLLNNDNYLKHDPQTLEKFLEQHMI